MVLSSAAEDFRLDSFRLGLFAMAEVLGVTLASASSWWWLRHTKPLQLALVGIVAFVLGNAMTPFVPVAWLIPLRFLTALLGEGLLLIVATALLGSAVQPSRVYALYMAAQMLFGALLLTAQGQLASVAGITGVMSTLVGLGLLTLLALPFIRQVSFRQPAQTGIRQRPQRAAILLLAGMGFYHLGVGGAWAFLQQRGIQQGLDFSSGGWMMSAIMATGLLGTLMAIIAGGRLGLRLAFTLGSLLLAAGGILVVTIDGLVWFFLGGMLLMVGWNLVVPYQIAALGREGPVTVQLALVPACQGAGLAAGPMLVGLFAGEGNYDVIAMLSVLSAAMALSCSLLGLRGQKT